MSIPAILPVSRPDRRASRITRTCTLDQTLIAWFDGLEHGRQVIAVQLLLDLSRHLVGVRTSDHYLIERGPAYLAARYSVSEETVQLVHLTILERIMGLVQGRRLSPKVSADQRLIDYYRSGEALDRPRRWLGIHWLVTGRARSALRCLLGHARDLGHAVPAARYSARVPLVLGGSVRGTLRARCPLVPAHGSDVALLGDGGAYCFGCRREIGRWEVRSGRAGHQLYPYVVETAETAETADAYSNLDGSQKWGSASEVKPSFSEAVSWTTRTTIESAGSPVNIFDEPITDDGRAVDHRRRVHRGQPASAYEADLGWSDHGVSGGRSRIRVAGYRYLTGPDRMARWLTPLDACAGARSPSRDRVAEALARVESGIATIRDLDVARGPDLDLRLRDWTTGRTIGQQWIALHVSASSVPTASDPEIDRAGARAGRTRATQADPALRWLSPGDQTLHRAGLAVQAEIRSEPWSHVLSGRVGVLRTGETTAVVLVELAALRQDPVGLWACPEYRAMLADLAALVGRHLQAQGWAGMRVQAPRLPGGRVPLPSWHRYVSGGAWALWRTRLVYGTPDGEPEAMYAPLPLAQATRGRWAA